MQDVRDKIGREGRHGLYPTRRRLVVWISSRGWSRIGLASLMLLVLGGLLLTQLPSASIGTTWTLPLSGKTVVLDAGHGGPDGGAVSKSGLIEKDLNLAIALQLRDYLQQAGAIVYVTREGDQDLAGAETKGYKSRKTEDLVARARFVEEKKADLMVSIHMNSIPSPRWSGAQTFYYPNHEGNPALAYLIQDEIRLNLANTNRSAAKAPNTVYLLKAVKTAPSALVEVGFLSHPGEAARLADGTYQRQVAASIYKGILRYSSGERPAGTTDKAARP
ncbi:N-acetylmuramoyl-L-alanine amidase CwlD [Paenibacillus pasadenensis]|uniref:N-acetylmuramoyl-L-alanine amidase n=1 Tax=Paenibacillus pasadenensis TaxID=217090 RepID=A0A2N5N1I4_9BACL|nr:MULTISPECIES: N-acetylmuramoyl-L-alanine amidase CwlD [Paenibacillus]PLT44183.1 N-acetylmuramoyl-L-alanine amidase [Paenibacillus pasadenensis]QGG54713.1 N-acetylmuramoyl-L-alanine amidase CwlD [Paenibacillus sp. B01]